MTETMLNRKRYLESKETDQTITESESAELKKIRSTMISNRGVSDLTEFYTIEDIMILFD